MRIALLSYRSKEHCGGQGVYVRHLAGGLAELGHQVEVISGQPYPENLDPRVTLTKLPSLDLFASFPVRRPKLHEFTGVADVVEYLTTLTGCFAEPLSFSLRAGRLLRRRGRDFDVVHDNQTLGYGLLGAVRRRIPLVATIHHPISRDRRIELDAATGIGKLSVARWYGFVRMQGRVARRIPLILGVSKISATDAAVDFRLDPRRQRVVPLGVDTDLFIPGAARVPGRIVAVASADRPLKGVAYLLDAIAKLRVDHDVHLELVSGLEPGGATDRRIDELGLREHVRVRSDLTDGEMAALMASAEIMCVPSLYEGFSLPTVEGMSCGTPLVVSRTGALPEVVGPDGECALLVQPADVGELTAALEGLLSSPERRRELGAAGRARALERFSWESVARCTAQVYAEAIEQVGVGRRSRMPLRRRGAAAPAVNKISGKV